MLYPVVFNAILPKKLKLNRWELAYVVAMMTPVLMVSGFSDGGFLGARTVTLLRAGLISEVTKDYVMKYASPLFGPKDINVLALIQTGGASVPWGEWAAPIAWYTVFYISFYSILLFIGVVNRAIFQPFQNAF